MLMDKDRLKLSKDILEQGYVLLDDKNLKTYLDGFTISYRNGLYYEIMDDFSYTTKYIKAKGEIVEEYQLVKAKLEFNAEKDPEQHIEVSYGMEF